MSYAIQQKYFNQKSHSSQSRKYMSPEFYVETSFCLPKIAVLNTNKSSDGKESCTCDGAGFKQ